MLLVTTKHAVIQLQECIFYTQIFDILIFWFTKQFFEQLWIFENLKKINKFGVIGKWMAKWNITLENFGNKGELKLKKMKIKILNFLCKIAADCKFWLQKLQSYLIIKM